MPDLLLRAACLCLVAGLTCPAQEPAAATEAGPQMADLRDFETWLQDYRVGAVRFMQEGNLDEPALQRLDELMGRVARWNTLGMARKLFEVASLLPTPPGALTSTELVDFHRELQPWRVQALARKHLCTMDGAGIVPWLLSHLGQKGVRGAQKNEDQERAAAVLRILGAHPSLEARLELMRACRTMPNELRVLAVNSMAQDAALETAPDLIELLRDAEPNVRIAAAAALGSALRPHVDETAGASPSADVLQTRDLAIQKLKELVQRDRVWQVRSAAAFALAGMRCKPVIPALIDGLAAELSRKKDPWAMDMRLHELLEGLTGQTVLPGDARLWQEFWRKEGATFTVRPKPAPGSDPAVANKYQRFFDLDIRSDRVLFVLDLSGSMAEPVQLQGRTTGARPGEPTTKAALVVAEMKKIVMALPDGAMFNAIVFSDEVRVWRQDRDGRPALVKLDDETRDDLLGSYLDGLKPKGPTNLYGALDKALDFGGRGLFDKYYEAGFDTLYVLSDGAPSWGDVTDPDEIRRRVRATNGLRRITIHCVTFGDKNATDFLRLLAEENGGRHIHVE